MNWIEGGLLLFGGLVVVMGLGLPVAFAFLALNVVGAMIFLGGEPGLAQLARNAVQSITSFSLTPIPFFVLMGEVLFHTGVALKAIDAFALLIRRVPGRLSVIAIVAGTVFSAISGSTIATTALLGSLMLPTMLARGYDPRLAMGPIMGIGGVDMLIPPSALTVLLGSLGVYALLGVLSVASSRGWISLPGSAEYGPVVLGAGLSFLLVHRQRRLEDALQSLVDARILLASRMRNTAASLPGSTVVPARTM